jgi:hypothetical protein
MKHRVKKMPHGRFRVQRKRFWITPWRDCIRWIAYPGSYSTHSKKMPVYDYNSRVHAEEAIRMLNRKRK